MPQRNLKRLLAYSGIANAGYLLMGIVAQSEAGTAAILYYLAGYLFALITIFLIINLLTNAGCHIQRVETTKSSLEDVFLSLTGKGINE